MGIIEETIRNMESGLYDFTNNGVCSGCGGCCSNYIPLSKKDISRIKKYIKSHNIKPCKHFVPTAEPITDFTCPFRDNDKKICTIYPVRPAICKDFKCDKARKGYMPSKEIFKEKYEVVLMREFFLGGEK